MTNSSSLKKVNSKYLPPCSHLTLSSILKTITFFTMNSPQQNVARARAKELMQRHAGANASTPMASTNAEHSQPAGPASFENFPGYQEYCRQRDGFKKLDMRNPYFSLHDGVQAATVAVNGREYLSFSGYNYLDLASHPALANASIAAIRRYGSTVSASRVVSGEIALHQQLERDMANFLGMDDAVTFVSGYGTNVSTLGHLFGPSDLIVHDALIHNSLMTGARLSGARRIAYPHNDYAALDRILKETSKQHRHTVIVTEGVFSMDGDIVDLPKLVDIKRRHNVFLMVDEAHSFGVLGKRGVGVSEHFDLPTSVIDIWMGTLSKSMASCGGMIAGSHALIANLRLNAPGGILYSVGLSPANTAAAIAALQVMQAEPERIEKLQHNSKFFLEKIRALGLDAGPAQGTPVAPVILGNSLKCLRVAEHLFDNGVQVHPILYPAVPEEASRLRFFITSGHSEEQLEQAANATAAAVAASTS